MVWAHARMETRLLVRNGEQLLLALVIPVLLLVGGAESGGVVNLGDGRRIDVLTPGVLALAIMSTSFTSLAIATGFERRYGVLKLLGASPLPRSGLLLGKVVSLVLVEAAQVVVICVRRARARLASAPWPGRRALGHPADDRRHGGVRRAGSADGRHPARGGHAGRGQPGLHPAPDRRRRGRPALVVPERDPRHRHPAPLGGARRRAARDAGRGRHLSRSSRGPDRSGQRSRRWPGCGCSDGSDRPAGHRARDLLGPRRVGSAACYDRPAALRCVGWRLPR